MNKRLLAFFLAGLLIALPAMAADELSRGQTLYLPVYSHVWHGDRVVEGKYPLKNQISALVSIRNTSLKTPIKVTSARYYDTNGKLLKEYLDKPANVNPMGTLELFVERKESAGGSGANFLILWESATLTNAPVVQALHADIKGHQNLIFLTTAQAIQPNK